MIPVKDIAELPVSVVYQCGEHGGEDDGMRDPQKSSCIAKEIFSPVELEKLSALLIDNSMMPEDILISKTYIIYAFSLDTETEEKIILRFNNGNQDVIYHSIETCNYVGIVKEKIDNINKLNLSGFHSKNVTSHAI